MYKRQRLDEAEDRIIVFGRQDRKKNTQAEQHTKKIFLKKESLRNILDNMKNNNICIMGIPEGEESKQGIENLFEEIMTENFPNLVKEKVTQVQEAQRVPNKLDPQRPTPRHIIIKRTRLKDKERILKASREKLVVTYKGAPIRLSSDTSIETFQAEGSGMKYSR